MTYIVTGASSGIGKAVAQSLAMRQQEVIAVARNVQELELLDSCCGGGIHIIPADLTTAAGRQLVLDKACDIGHLSGIVHAAGSLIAAADYQSINTDTIADDFTIHVSVPIFLNNALADKLAGARILYIDSYSANNLRVGWPAYSIVKAAAQMSARAAAEEIATSKVVRVFPGAVRTPLVEAILTAEKESPTVTLFRELDLNGEICEPDVVGNFIANILLIASDDQLDAHEVWNFNNPQNHIF